MKHPYADILVAIANGEQIQWQTVDGEWLNRSSDQTLREIVSTSLPIASYRIKPKTIRIGEFDVPEPLRVAPEEGTKLYLAGPHFGRTAEFCWCTGRSELNWLDLGLIHTTKEAAQIHLDALLSFTRRSA